MRLSTSKLLLMLVLAMTATCIVTPGIAFADAYLRVQDANSNRFYSSYGQDSSGIFDELNKTYFGGAAYPSKGYNNINYIVLPGSEKREGIFKLQKSSNGQQDGPREDLIFGTKHEAESFCTYLAEAASDFEYSHIKNGTVFVSDYLGGIKQVIAVAYHAGAHGNLSPSKKYVFCPNRWATDNEYWNKPDPRFPDENDVNGIKASGFVNGEEQVYTVVCMNSQTPHSLFAVADWVGYLWVEVNTAYGSTLTSNPSLELLDWKVGIPYCTGGRPYSPRSGMFF